MQADKKDTSTDCVDKVRLDKWLWAARFFRTRALSKAAIEKGRVCYNGQRVKVSKLVEVGALLTVRQGYDERQVIVRALAVIRKSAKEAVLLYEETPESYEKRLLLQKQRQDNLQFLSSKSIRPTKKGRRQIKALKDSHKSDVESL